MATLTLGVDFETITCCNSECGISFAVPAHWRKQKLRDHSWWYCPNGHHQHYPGTSDIEKAKAEAEALRSQLAAETQSRKYWTKRAEQERKAKEGVKRSRAAVKGQLTKVKRRVANGVCPCCNRHFEDLQLHMAAKHADYVEATP